jgi:hypothetical protein
MRRSKLAVEVPIPVLFDLNSIQGHSYRGTGGPAPPQYFANNHSFFKIMQTFII